MSAPISLACAMSDFEATRHILSRVTTEDQLPTHPEDGELKGSSIFEDDEPERPNRWTSFRQNIREPAAEFLGTMLLVMFGLGVNCQVVLSSSAAVASSPKGSYDTAVLGWGIGAAAGVRASAGISGGHINPAVSLAQVVLRRFPLRKLPIYVLAQVAGAFIGTLVVYGNYSSAISLYEGGPSIRTVPGTAELFATFPLDYVTSAGAFFNEFLATALLLILLASVTDKRNSPPATGLVPLAVFFAFVGIPAAFGMQTSFAMNPARDFGPRLVTAIFYGRKVWSFRNQYWLWGPIIAPCLGAIAGLGLYDLLIYAGPDSRINQVFGEKSPSTAKAHKESPPSPTNKLERLV